MNPGKNLTGMAAAVLAISTSFWSCGAGPGDRVTAGTIESYGGQAITIPVPVDRRPICDAVGSRSEGWYWDDSDELIAFANCHGRCEPECRLIGSRSEGWFCNQELITWYTCHQAVGLAVWGEPCHGDSGLVCYEGLQLYCMQKSYSPTAPPGKCFTQGFCQTSQDCLAPGNYWIRPACDGQAFCRENQCVWRCFDEPEGYSVSVP